MRELPGRVRRREVFYWLAVICTFAMGTALGDLFATSPPRYGGYRDHRSP